jgi:hypothetical protein
MSIESDTASVDSILAALYESICRTAGERPDWDRMRPLFIEGARVIPPAPQSGPPAVMDSGTSSVQRTPSRAIICLKTKGVAPPPKSSTAIGIYAIWVLLPDTATDYFTSQEMTE